MSETKPSENFKCQKYLQLVTPKLLVSFLERTLVDALLEIRNGLMQAICVIFSSVYLYNLEDAVRLSFSQVLFRSNSCFVRVNLL